MTWIGFCGQDCAWTEKEAAEMEWTNKHVIANTDLNPGLRADFMRLEILFNLGGVYADVDMTCEQPIGPLLEKAAGRFTIGISNT